MEKISLRSKSKKPEPANTLPAVEPKGKRAKSAQKQDPSPEKKVKTSDSIDVKASKTSKSSKKD